MDSKYKIILGCIFFNLLLEYWAHGIEYFVVEWHAAPMLFLLYLTYFSMLEDLIVRYHLIDYQLINAGFIFGLFHETLNTGSVFGSGVFFGVDPIILLLVNIGWWGFLQSVLAMYFANRLSKRNWTHSKMGKAGWILSVSFNIFVFIAILFNPSSPKGTIPGYTTALALNGLAIFFFWKTLKPKDVLPFNKSRLLDLVITIQSVLCVVVGTFIGFDNYVIGDFPRHEFIVVLLVLWTLLSGSIVLTYRIITRKSIPV